MAHAAWQCLIASVLVSTVAFAPYVAHATNVGVTSAVLPEATGAPPDGEPRVLQVGVDLVADERIVTGDIGKTHVLFLDGSALTIGPKSDVVLDEFVYDPDTKQGRIALSASKGLLRFVGGRISKTTPVQIRTPSATIGIRGGIAILSIGAGVLTAKFLFGDEMTISANGNTVTVNRPGFQVTVSGDEAPANPTAIPNEELVADVDELEGSPEQTESTSETVTQNDVSGSQISSLNSEAPPPPPVGGPGPLPPDPANNDDITDTVTDQGTPDAPPVLALPGVATTAGKTVKPFADVAISGTGGVTVLVAIVDTGSGSFTPASLAATGFTALGGGVFSFAGSVDAARAALKGLTFQAADGSPRTGEIDKIDFAIALNNGSTTKVAQQTLTVSCATFCEYSLGGRVKIGQDTALGTNDTVASQNRPITGFNSAIAGSRFKFSTAAGDFNLFLPSGAGSFDIDGVNEKALTPFGSLTGEGFLSAFGDFLMYALNGSQIVVFAGVPADDFTPGNTLVAANYRLIDDFGLGNTEIPFIPASLQENSTNALDPRLTIMLGTNGADRFFFAGNILIDGTGDTQGMAGSVLVGLGRTVGGGAGSYFLSGRMRGFVDAGSTGFAPWEFGGPVATADDANGFDFFGTGLPRATVLISANVDASDNDLGGGGIVQSQGTANENSVIFPNVAAINEQNNLGTFFPSGGGGNNQRASRTLKGYVGGAALERDASNLPIQNAVFLNDIAGEPFYDGLTITTDIPTNRIFVEMDIVSGEDGFSGDGESETVIGYGGLASPGRSAFLDNSTFVAVEQAAAITVNDNSGTLTGFFVTNDQVRFTGGALPAGVSLCTCSQLQWGFFNATIFDPGASTYEVTLAQWVAGEVPTAGQVPSMGIATYEGHVAVAVVNGDRDTPGATNRYNALGSVTLKLAFSPGDIAIDTGSSMTFDGTTYTIDEPISGNDPTPPEFEFDITDGDQRNGYGIGSLFGGGTPPKQAGASFSLKQTGPTIYQAAGIFATDLKSFDAGGGGQ